MKNVIAIIVVSLTLLSCGSPQSGWTEEEAINQLCGGCFDGTTQFGPQKVCFNTDGTWYRNYTSQGITYGEMRGTWSLGEYNDEYDWWIINLDGGSSTTNLSTISSETVYISGWGKISSGTKEMKEE
jgi:hypothetical protein